LETDVFEATFIKHNFFYISFFDYGGMTSTSASPVKFAPLLHRAANLKLKMAKFVQVAKNGTVAKNGISTLFIANSDDNGSARLNDILLDL
jgi:hypothetical protein